MVLGALGQNHLARWKNKENNHQWSFSVVCGGQYWKIWNGKNGKNNKRWQRMTESWASHRCDSQGLSTFLRRQWGLLQSSAGKCKLSIGIFFFFSFILQKWVSEITRIERSARCVFSHLFRFHKANFGKRIDFSFRRKLCWNAVCSVGYRKWIFPPALKRERQLFLPLWHLWPFGSDRLAVPMCRDQERNRGDRAPWELWGPAHWRGSAIPRTRGWPWWPLHNTSPEP